METSGLARLARRSEVWSHNQELIEHLEAKVEAKNMKSHPLIDEFIPTIEEEDGICYTHPEKLPAVRYTLWKYTRKK